MPTATTLRDSTEIRLRREDLDPVREDLEAEFMVTVIDGDAGCRIVGSPVVIKQVGEWLSRRGLRLR
jgi:hypothetical protein